MSVQSNSELNHLIACHLLARLGGPSDQPLPELDEELRLNVLIDELVSGHDAPSLADLSRSEYLQLEPICESFEVACAGLCNAGGRHRVSCFTVARADVSPHVLGGPGCHHGGGHRGARRHEGGRDPRQQPFGLAGHDVCAHVGGDP